jgi:hypothetical protein
MLAAPPASPTIRPTAYGIATSSLKIAEGVPVTEVAAQVGQARKSLTLDTYAHVLVE